MHSVTTMRSDKPHLSRHSVVVGRGVRVRARPDRAGMADRLRWMADNEVFDRHLLVPAGPEFEQTVLTQPRRSVWLTLEASLP